MTDIAIEESTGEVTAIATGNGQDEFDFDFVIFDETWLVVYLNYVDEDSEPLELTTDYTVSGVNDQEGGTVTLDAALAATIVTGDELIIRREIPIERSADYPTAGDFRAATINQELDTLFMILQELRRDVDAGGIVGHGGVFSAIASQAEAEAGTNNTKGMTPLRTAQALGAAGAERMRVRVATTGNITIATALNNGDTIDGVVLATGDRVLVKSQTAPAENGIYVVGATPARATDYDTFNEHPGGLIAVEEGTDNADSLWINTSDRGGVLGVADITFEAALSAGMVLISDTSPSAVATVDYANLSGYSVIRITLINVKPATDGAILNLLTSVNNGAAFDAGASDYVWAYYGRNPTSGSTINAGDDLDTALEIGGTVGNAANETINGVIELLGFNVAAHMGARYDVVFVNAATERSIVSGGGMRLSTTARDAFRLLFSSGNIASGRIIVEGRA